MRTKTKQQPIMMRAAATLLLMVLTMTAQTAWAEWSGSGTLYDPYLIKTTDDLNLLAHRVNGTHGETANDYLGKYFKLANDIAYSYTNAWNVASTEDNFEPIGNYSSRFLGDFDGAGHTISGIRISRSGNNNNNANFCLGIFGHTDTGAYINGLTLADARITGDYYIGGIVGYFVGGQVIDCHVADDVAVCAVSKSAYYHGGIVGDNEFGYISGCTSAVTLTLTDAINSHYYGGIAGINFGGTLRDNFVIGATIPAVKDNTYGAISGLNGDTLDHNYYTACTVAGTVNATGVGCNKADVTTNDGAVPGYLIILGEGISIASGATTFTIPAHGETAEATHHVAANGAQVTLVEGEGYNLLSVTYNDGSGDHAVSPNADGEYIFTMPAANVTVSADITAIPWAGEGTAGNPYLIEYASQLNLLAHRVNGTHGETANDYSGKYFKLANDIDYKATTLWNDANSTENNFETIGGYFDDNYRTFMGDFDGDGHTISGIRIYKGGSGNANSFQGIFGYTGNGANIHDFTLADARITSFWYTGGIAGINSYGCTLSGCHVADDVAVCAVKYNTNYHGGIVGSNHGTISDCTSAATLTLTDAANSQYFGGIVGNNSDGTLRNNLAIGATVPAAKDNTHGAITGLNGGTLDHNYYTACTVDGTVNATGVGSNKADVTTNDGAVPGYFITLAEDLSIASGATTITIPAHGETAAVRHHVAAHGAQVILVCDEGYYQISITYNDGSGDHAVSPDDDGKYTITMPAANVTVSADLTAIPWAGEGTAGNPYIIEYASQLNLLAYRVNGTHGETANDYAGKYFKLANDITYKYTTQWNDANSTENNFEAIGGYFDDNFRTFMGDFDGAGHTISGIRIYKGDENYQGLFGRINIANIHDLTLADTRITGYLYTGGIVGFNQGGTLSGCHVADDVAICAVSESIYYHGGIVGSNETGTIRGCTSAVTLTDAANSRYYGGIAGYNDGGTLRDNFVIGATIPATNDYTHGAITGENSGGTLERNYYTACKVASENVTPSGVGCGNPVADVTTNDGAVPAGFTQNGNTYTISNAGGWYVFCHLLAENAKGYFTGKTVVLANDIEVSRMAGSSNHDFTGTFDGGNHTLTFNHAASDNYCAPFRYVQGNAENDHAVIRRLNVVSNITAADYRHPAGLIALQSGFVDVTDCNVEANITCTKGTNNPSYLYPAALVSQSNNTGSLTVSGCTTSGTIATDGMNAAGIIGIVQHAATIRNSLSSVTIQSSTDGDGTHGGLIASQANSPSITIEGCVFNGKLLGSTTNKVGGFIGWDNSGATITNSLFAPAEVTISTTGCATFVRNGAVGNNCYYTRTLGTAQDKQARSITAGDDVSVEAIALTGTATAYNVSGITAYSGGGLSCGGTLYYGSGDQVSLTLSHAERQGYNFNGYQVSAGTLSGTTLTMPDEDVIVTANYYSSSDLSLSGTTYTIKTTTGWDLFCDMVEDGQTFDGKTVVLGNDIEVTRMAGSSATQFRGTFNGDGHRLTLSYGSEDEPLDAQFVAPFPVVTGGAKFIDLTIDGNIYADYTGSAEPGVGGLIGHLYGDISIEGCTSTVEVNSTKDRVGGFVGLCEHAVTFTDCRSSASVTCTGSCSGFVGWSRASEREYTIAFEGCLFDGKVLQKDGVGSGNGGFLGWKGTTKTVTIKNSLVALDDVESMANGSGATFARGWSGTPDNSYYTTAFGTAQGTAAYVYTPADNDFVPVNVGAEGTAYSVSGITAYANGLKYDGQFYLVKAAVILEDDADNSDNITDGQVADVTLQGRTLYKDGEWNTICLPFDVTISDDSPLADAEARTLADAELTGTHVELTFGDQVTTLSAGVPYIIRWEANDNGNLVEPTFAGVTINSNSDGQTLTFANGNVQFIGYYDAFSIDADDKDVYYLTSGNTFKHTAAGRTLNACRAYFRFSEAAQARQFVLNFGENGGTTTGIVQVDKGTTNTDGSTYDLLGRKAPRGQLRKGLYIKDGKKVVVK